jgi:hypothetical protein
VKLRVRRGEIDKVIRVREGGLDLTTLRMPNECFDLRALERAREPLHVVLHKDLHCGAIDGAGTLDRAVRAAPNRHVRAEQKLSRVLLFCHFGRRTTAFVISTEAKPLLCHFDRSEA